MRKITLWCQALKDETGASLQRGRGYVVDIKA
jgi:hypothetical protein